MFKTYYISNLFFEFFYITLTKDWIFHLQRTLLPDKAWAGYYLHLFYTNTQYGKYNKGIIKFLWLLVCHSLQRWFNQFFVTIHSAFPAFRMELFQSSFPVLKHLTFFMWEKSLIPVYKYLKITLLQASLTRIIFKYL